MTDLKGTVAVVTGAGRGIGREIALHQARSGAKVAVLARTASEIDKTASLITGEGGVALSLPVDLVDRRAVEQVLDRVASELGPIDLVVNNHGSFRAFGPIAGKTYLPNIQQLFDDGINIPPSRAAELIVDIATGRFDTLAGRLLRAIDDRELLEQQMKNIVAHDARALRFSGVEQDKL
jgi:NAD(P)-dependent dehydrogenase (short-subunit alcohol dehydrogenase family)